MSDTEKLDRARQALELIEMWVKVASDRWTLLHQQDLQSICKKVLDEIGRTE